MIALQIPGVGQACWQHLILDLNGTLTTDGVLLSGVAERLAALDSQLDIQFLTADTHGCAADLAARLGVQWTRVRAGQEAEQKERFVQKLGATSVVAIGSGANDAKMLAASGLGIIVLGEEGAAIQALLNADIMSRSITEALDLLLTPKRLLASLRR